MAMFSYQSFQSFNRVTPLLTRDPVSARAGPLSDSCQTLSAAAEPSLHSSGNSGIDQRRQSVILLARITQLNRGIKLQSEPELIGFMLIAFHRDCFSLLNMYKCKQKTFVTWTVKCASCTPLSSHPIF